MYIVVLYDNTNSSKRFDFLTKVHWLVLLSHPLAFNFNYFNNKRNKKYFTVVNACIVSLTIILGMIYDKI